MASILLLIAIKISENAWIRSIKLLLLSSCTMQWTWPFTIGKQPLPLPRKQLCAEGLISQHEILFNVNYYEIFRLLIFMNCNILKFELG